MKKSAITSGGEGLIKGFSWYAYPAGADFCSCKSQQNTLGALPQDPGRPAALDTDLDFSVTKNLNPYCTQMGLKRACGAFLSPLRWSAERRTTTPVPSSKEGDYGADKQIL